MFVIHNYLIIRFIFRITYFDTKYTNKPYNFIEIYRIWLAGNESYIESYSSLRDLQNSIISVCVCACVSVNSTH